MKRDSSSAKLSIYLVVIAALVGGVGYAVFARSGSSNGRVPDVSQGTTEEIAPEATETAHIELDGARLRFLDGAVLASGGEADLTFTFGFGGDFAVEARRKSAERPLHQTSPVQFIAEGVVVTDPRYTYDSASDKGRLTLRARLTGKSARLEFDHFNYVLVAENFPTAPPTVVRLVQSEAPASPALSKSASLAEPVVLRRSSGRRGMGANPRKHKKGRKPGSTVRINLKDYKARQEQERFLNQAREMEGKSAPLPTNDGK